MTSLFAQLRLEFELLKAGVSERRRERRDWLEQLMERPVRTESTPQELSVFGENKAATVESYIKSAGLSATPGAETLH